MSLDDPMTDHSNLLRQEPSGRDGVESLELARFVSDAVAELPEEQREVIVLKEYQGLTFVEIAEALDLPTSTVKTRLYRGLVQLREALERKGITSAAALAVP